MRGRFMARQFAPVGRAGQHSFGIHLAYAGIRNSVSTSFVLAVEIRHSNGELPPGFPFEDCLPVTGDDIDRAKKPGLGGAGLFGVAAVGYSPPFVIMALIGGMPLWLREPAIGLEPMTC
jgi:hypothetical protein